MSADHAAAAPSLELNHADDGTLLVRLAGDWTLRAEMPSSAEIQQAISSPGRPARVAFDTTALGRWDSALLNFLLAVRDITLAAAVEFSTTGLPPGVCGLIRLATAVPERSDSKREASRSSTLGRLGAAWLAFVRSSGEAVSFVGEATISLGKLLVGRAQVRRSDLLLLIEQSGAQALPIVALISVLVGLILAFVGAVQLKIFGAQIYVANLVAIGMTREMGAMMTAIIMAGRTGAAFAAQLGTMQVNEEIDALKTLGVPPVDFLVLPRMVALIVMMPLLCVYADVMGILGGFIVGIGMLDLPPTQYWTQTLAWVRPGDFALGVVKSSIFGIIIAVSGCLRGMQCGRSAAAVGAAATSAVVTAIVWIIVADGICAVITNILGI